MPAPRRLRVASTGDSGNLVRQLYRPVRDDVELVEWPVETWLWNDRFRAALPDVDLIHLHWPENRFGLNPQAHHAAIAAVKEAGVPVVWTAHDAVPHNFEPGDRSAIYQLWAEAADGIIHNSAFGEAEMKRLYRFGPALHHVIHLPHWGSRLAKFAGTREEAEKLFHLPPAALRIGIHGSPRPAKDVQLAMNAFAASRRQDLQLFVSCLRGESVPNDPRIIAIPYTFQRGDDFRYLLRSIDVFLLPFKAGYSTLSTGTVMDAVALRKPMIVSSWPYFAEVAGAAGICYGSTREDLTRCLDALMPEQIAAATEASSDLNKRWKFKHAATETLAFLREVLAATGPRA